MMSGRTVRKVVLAAVPLVLAGSLLIGYPQYRSAMQATSTDQAEWSLDSVGTNEWSGTTSWSDWNPSRGNARLFWVDAPSSVRAAGTLERVKCSAQYPRDQAGHVSSFLGAQGQSEWSNVMKGSRSRLFLGAVSPTKADPLLLRVKLLGDEPTAMPSHIRVAATGWNDSDLMEEQSVTEFMSQTLVVILLAVSAIVVFVCVRGLSARNTPRTS